MPNIGGFLRRKLRVSLPGIVEIEAGAAEEQQKPSDMVMKTSAPNAIQLEEIEGLPRTKAIEAVERNLHARLPSVKGDPINVLVRNLAQSRLEADFGIVYARLFGTQISALIWLEALRKVTNRESLEFYQTNVEKPYEEFYRDYGYVGWLGFMIERSLVYHADNDNIGISDIGIDFITWLKANKLPANKAW